MKYELTDEHRRAALQLLYKKHYKKPSRKSKVLFRQGSAVYQAFELCRDGCTVKELYALAEKCRTDPKWLFRIFRREVLRGYRWQWIEAEGRVRAIYPDPREGQEKVRKR